MEPGVQRERRRAAAARPLVALGTRLALRGPASVGALALAAAGSLVAAALAASLQHRDAAAATDLPAIAGESVAWAAGLTLAFTVGMRMFHSGEEAGFAALARARGASPSDYAAGRVVGLAVVLAAFAGIPAALVGLVAVATGGGWPAARSTWGALVYALVFAVTMGPVSIACLAAGSRAVGYVRLLAVVVAPELAAPWTTRLLPTGWGELASIPAAIDAVRTAAMHPLVHVQHGARALAALCAVVAVAFVAGATRLSQLTTGGRRP